MTAIIWRTELWYFEFQAGGWAKVNQQAKVLDRQRFANPDAYRAYVNKLRWVPRLGNPKSTSIELQKSDLVAGR